MFEKILLPLDGSELSEQAVASARGMAQAFNSQLHLLQVLSLGDQFALTRGMDYGAVSSGLSQSLMDEVTAAETAKAEGYLAAVAVRLRADGLDVVTAIPDGPAAEKNYRICRSPEHRLDSYEHPWTGRYSAYVGGQRDRPGNTFLHSPGFGSTSRLTPIPARL